jgi:hypothetical protein
MHVVSRRVFEMSLSEGCAECEEGGEASDGGCVGRAGAARDDGENANVITRPVTSESVGQRGVFVADELCGLRVVSLDGLFPFSYIDLSN